MRTFPLSVFGVFRYRQRLSCPMPENGERDAGLLSNCSSFWVRMVSRDQVCHLYRAEGRTALLRPLLAEELRPKRNGGSSWFTDADKGHLGQPLPRACLKPLCVCPSTTRKNGVVYSQGPGREWWRLRLGQVVTVISNRDVCPLGEGGAA